MQSKIHTLPSEQNAGLGFNYERWTANTTVTLCSVPWNSDYRDVVKYYSQKELNEFLSESSGPTIEIKHAMPLKFGRPISLDVDFSIALEFNYIHVHNPAQPFTGSKQQDYYYFIGEVAYGAPSTTHFMVQLDVFQTFIYTTEFGNCYIDRGHIGIANQNSFEEFGRMFLSIPEGLDVGGEYGVVKNYSRSIAKSLTNLPAGDVGPADLDYSIMVVSTIDLTADPGEIKTPNNPMATGSKMQNMPNGSNIYIFDNPDRIANVLAVFKNKGWMTAGITSITAIPKVSRYQMSVRDVHPHGYPEIIFGEAGSGNLYRPKNTMAFRWRDEVKESIPARYRHLKKLLTFPYCMVEMTSYTGTPVVIKPESWQDEDGNVIEVALLAPPSMRVAFYPYRYNNANPSIETSNASGVLNDGGEFLDMTTNISNFPQFSTLNNAYSGYMAANANSIAYQHSSADWSQQKALAGNQLSQNNSYTGFSAASDITGIGVRASNDQTNLQNSVLGNNMALSAGENMAKSLSGGPLGAAGGLAGAALNSVRVGITMDANNQSTGISTGASMASTNRSNAAGMSVADSNKAYADMASRGDYANSIAGINAKIQDAKMIQNTTVGQVGGEAFNFANYQWGVDLKVKMIRGAALATVGEYWLRYGYAVSRFGTMPDSLHVMTRFTYWKLQETYIVSAKCPESFKQALRGIFEKGVTVWKNANDIGRIDIADNMPLEGVIL